MCNEFQDIFNQAHTSGPITRAQAKLIKYKDTTQLALSLLKSETEIIMCRDHCTECECEENYFKNQHLLEFQWCQLKLAEARCKQWQKNLLK